MPWIYSPHLYCDFLDLLVNITVTIFSILVKNEPTNVFIFSDLAAFLNVLLFSESHQDDLRDIQKGYPLK